jgi:hypothetical protein
LSRDDLIKRLESAYSDNTQCDDTKQCVVEYKRKVIHMLKMSSRHSHFVFGVLQAGLTSAIAAAIASISFVKGGMFVPHWLTSWSISWVTMLPVVVTAAPFIRRVAERIVR